MHCTQVNYSGHSIFRYLIALSNLYNNYKIINNNFIETYTEKIKLYEIEAKKRRCYIVIAQMFVVSI